jgi:hypothetical protein
VASAVIYTPVANLTALAALTPTNGDYFELTDSTGAESSALITGVTVGLVGAPGLTFRLRYDAPPGIFTFLGYFANDSETRYLKLAGGTLTGQLRGDDSTSASTPGFAFDGDPNTGVGRPGADELALITGGTARVTIDSAGAVNVVGALTKGSSNVVTVGDTGTVTSTMILDGTIVDGDVNASAAIAGTKISPNFGSQNVVTTGTSSAAALIPTGSSVPTNGTYLPAANAVAIATNSTERLRIDSSGRLGLGTSSPTGLLTVASASPVIDWTNSSNTAFKHSIESTNYSSTAANNTFAFKVASGSGTQATVMTLNGAGQVGIGTLAPGQIVTLQSPASGTAPTLKLQNPVDAASSQGAANNLSAGQLLFGATGTYPLTAKIESLYSGDASFGRSSSLIFSTSDGGGGISEKFRCDQNGRFLIGTSTTLPVYYNAASAWNGNFQVARSDQNAVANFSIWNSDASTYTAYGGVQLHLSACRSGTVGTHTSGALTSGDTIGSITFDASDGTDFRNSARIEAVVDGGVSTGDVPGRLVFSTTRDSQSSPLERMRITNLGETAIGTTNNGLFVGTTQGAGTTYALFIGRRSITEGSAFTTGVDTFVVYSNGNVQNTNNSYGGISDIKLKENIVDSGSQWVDIKAFRVRKYNLKEGQTHTQIGLVAQEAELVSPGLVYETPDRDEDGNDLGTVTKGINYSVLYMKAVKALQEAMERIEVLEQRLADAGIA